MIFSSIMYEVFSIGDFFFDLKKYTQEYDIFFVSIFILYVII